LALVRYIHLNAVRAGLAKRPERYPHSGHNSYLMNGTAKIVEAGPILRLLGGKKGYEGFVLEGMSESHNEDYYAVKDQRFLGEEGFGEELSRRAGVEEERKPRRSIEAVLKEIARELQTTPDLLRGRDRRWDVSTKRTQAVVSLVREHGYRVSEVAQYLPRDQAHISTMLARFSARKQK